MLYWLKCYNIDWKTLLYRGLWDGIYLLLEVKVLQYLESIVILEKFCTMLHYLVIVILSPHNVESIAMRCNAVTSALLLDRLTLGSKNVEWNTEKVVQYLESIAIFGKYCQCLVISVLSQDNIESNVSKYNTFTSAWLLW